MKRLVLLFLATGSLYANAQVKKVILEDFTGSWCQYCPNGSKGIEDLEALYPTNFLPVATHNSNGDPLEIPEGMAVKVGLDVTGVPSGAIDRKKLTGTKIPIGINANADQWKNQIPNRINMPAIVSVSFANPMLKNGTTYEADIKVKFTSAPAGSVPINLQVYILEDSIAATLANGLDQTNSTTHYGGTNPLLSPQYWHNHTLRAALGGSWGWAGVIPNVPVVGQEYTKHISFTVPATGVPPTGTWVKSRVHLYAFVSYDGLATDDRKEILNAEEIKLSSFPTVGIYDVNPVSVVSAYPNPARASNVVRIEYNISKSSDVNLKVYNAIGQLVANPYNSHEVAGVHTIQWRPSESNLTPGMYILCVSTPEGSTTSKLNIQ